MSGLNSGPKAGRILPSRRGFLALTAATGVALLPRFGSAAALPENRTFRVFHEGTEIGSHRVTFAPAARGFTADVAIDIAVKIAFITAYRYTQAGRDQWVDGHLVAADYRTDDNGKISTLEARAEDDALMVEGPSGRLELPRGSMTDLGFWNEAILHAPMVVNSQTGEAAKLDAVGGSPEQIIVLGSAVQATRYTMSSTKGRSGAVWYSADGHWVKARIVTHNETLDYELA